MNSVNFFNISIQTNKHPFSKKNMNIEKQELRFTFLNTDFISGCESKVRDQAHLGGGTAYSTE